MNNTNNRLEYKNYRGCKDILTIDLYNDYSVIAIKIWNPDEHKYNVQLMLKENTVDKWVLIEKAESLEFNVDYKIINKAILKHVATLLSEGFFDYYIERYEFELKCFDIGYETLENEKSNKKLYKVIKGKLQCMTVYYCSNCGDYVELDHEFCPHCRVELDWSDINV